MAALLPGRAVSSQPYLNTLAPAEVGEGRGGGWIFIQNKADGVKQPWPWPRGPATRDDNRGTLTLSLDLGSGNVASTTTSSTTNPPVQEIPESSQGNKTQTWPSLRCWCYWASSGAGNPVDDFNTCPAWQAWQAGAANMIDGGKLFPSWLHSPKFSLAMILWLGQVLVIVILLICHQCTFTLQLILSNYEYFLGVQESEGLRMSNFWVAEDSWGLFSPSPSRLPN